MITGAANLGRCVPQVNIRPRMGNASFMTSDDVADLNQVMVPTEEVHPDHREHAKESKHLDDGELERRTQHEREIVDAERPGQER